MNKKIAMAQIEVKTGDINGNVERVLSNVQKAFAENADFILFPEMTISGYNCGDLFEKVAFIDECQRGLMSIVKESNNYPDLVIILGCPRFQKRNLYNSAYVIMNGIIIDRYDKQLLANDYHHEDRKYFKAGTSNKTVYLKGIKFGIIICEDGWTENGYGRDIVNELNAEHVDVIFSLNFSYFTYNKKQIRESLFRKKYGCPIVYVNCVGVGDITKNFILYDGNSFYTEGNNNLTYMENADFKEAFQVINLTHATIDSLAHNVRHNERDHKYFDIHSAILYAQKNIFNQCGMKVAQVHISGGIDSAIVGYFAVKAMGKENVVFITQPSKNNGQETLNNAYQLANALGVELISDPIIDYIQIYKEKNPDYTKAQIASFEATLRKSLGFSYTHKYKSGVVACGNHTENVLGFFGFGDIGSMGVYQPIGDLTKVELYELAKCINEEIEHCEIIPKRLYNGEMKPAAELEDIKEDPFDYEIMSVICEKIIREGETPKQIFNELRTAFRYSGLSDEYLSENIDKAWTLSKRSVYKRAQSAPVLILSNRSIGFSSRETIINHYK